MLASKQEVFASLPTFKPTVDTKQVELVAGDAAKTTSIGTNLSPKFGKPKLTLGELGVEAMFTKLFENEAKMLFMLFFRSGVDKNVVKIDHHEFVEILHEDIIHEARESCWSIGEAKGHDGVFIETVPSSKGGLWNILLANFYLMVTASQVQLREHYGTCKLIEEILDARKGIFILDCFCI
jgi:hypothetical protein